MLFLTQALIGFVFYYVVKAIKYMNPVKFEFSFTIWYKENLGYFILGLILLLLCWLAMMSGDNFISQGFQLVGISMPEPDEDGNYSAGMLGLLIAGSVRHMNKVIKPEQKS